MISQINKENFQDEETQGPIDPIGIKLYTIVEKFMMKINFCVKIRGKNEEKEF